jgi:Leucine-rich repeat (LRR) protein
MGAQASTLSKRTERAEKTGVLALRDCGLQTVPDKVWTVRSLRVLDLTNNKLVILPAAVGQLLELKDVTLDSNKLAVLPSSICMLPKLEKLSASFNALTSLPGAIGSLAKLKQLIVSHNHLAELPDSVCHCKAIQLLDASHNKLRTLPPHIGELAALFDLRLGFNALSSPLPESLGAAKPLPFDRLPATARERPSTLTPVDPVVRIHPSQKATLLARPMPPVQSSLPGSLSRLKSLDLRSNPRLSELPESLLRDTPLQQLQADEALLGKDGVLREDLPGREAYMERRKARIDKEMHSKATGGDLNFSS